MLEMKTKQEQIEEMARAMCGFCVVDKRCVLRCCAPCSDVESKDCSYKENAKMLIDAGYGNISEYKAYIEQLKDENCELTEKLAKQTRIARDANAKFTGVEHYLKPFQYKADRLQTKCDDLKKLSDWQREEIKMLKAEVNKGCDNCETIKQCQVDVLKELKRRYDYAIKNIVYQFDITQQIDKLIKEIENDK